MRSRAPLDLEGRTLARIPVAVFVRRRDVWKSSVGRCVGRSVGWSVGARSDPDGTLGCSVRVWDLGGGQ